MFKRARDQWVALVEPARLGIIFPAVPDFSYQPKNVFNSGWRRRLFGGAAQ